MEEVRSCMAAKTLVRRPLTIDCKNRKELNQRLAEIRRMFMTDGDDPTYWNFQSSRPAYSVHFDLDERR